MRTAFSVLSDCKTTWQTDIITCQQYPLAVTNGNGNGNCETPYDIRVHLSYANHHRAGQLYPEFPS